jgi:hypothetical protein
VDYFYVIVFIVVGGKTSLMALREDISGQRRVSKDERGRT